MSFNYFFSFLVILNLIHMLPTVNFNDKLVALTAEISDISIDYLLSFEFHPVKPAGT